jgi:ligand-binding sensor domain-containing protein/two-component sensor histidine kinase
MRKPVVIVCCLVVLSIHLYSQQALFKSYTMQDGLVSNPVRRIFQDSKGFMWIATLDGLSKYDGHRFTNFNAATGLSHSLVNDMLEEDGKLYVALNNGTVDVFRNDIIIDRVKIGVTFNTFFQLKNGKILASTDSAGVWEFQKGRFIKPPQGVPHYSSIEIIEFNDSLLVSVVEYEPALLTKDYHEHPNKMPVQQLLAGMYFRCAYKDSKNRTWIGTDKGLRLFAPFTNNPHSFVFTDLPKELVNAGMDKKAVMDILESSNGDMWFATLDGLVRIKPDGSSYTFTNEDGLPSNAISCLFEDKEKNIWAGTRLGLAKIVTANNIRVHSTKTGLASNLIADVTSLQKGLLLLSTVNGIQQYDPLTRHSIFIPYTDDPSTHFFVSKGPYPLLYSSTMVGRYDTSRREIIDKKFFGGVFCTILDPMENLFVATGEGLVWYPKNLPPVVVLPRIRFEVLLLTKDEHLWAGTWEKGLYEIEYSLVQNKPTFTVKDVTSLINAINIRGLFEDSKGNIWVGTRYSGVFCLRKKYTRDYHVLHIGQADGLMSDWVRSFAEDKEGNIWTATLLGLDKLIAEGDTYRVFNFSRITNFFGEIGKIFTAADNNVWFIESGHLVQFSDEHLETKKPLPAYITSITLGNANQKNIPLQPDTAISLQHYQNQLQFEFSAPGFINEKQILYSYRLAGTHETAWSVPANVHTVSYASLQPGDYRFEVRTLGWNMELGNTTYFSFSIKPPFWQTWWFIGICILLLALLFYIFYRYRINQLKKLQTVRNRIATDLHDDFGATVTNIGILSELSIKKLEEPQEAKIFLSRITEEVTALGQSLDDIIWSVNSGHDTMEETLARMRRYAAELFDNSYTQCQLQFDEVTVGKKLNMEQRRDVYLIYKESLNNIHKHASAKQVLVKAGLHQHHFEMLIQDDGKGFQQDQPSHRNGLKNMQARAEKWNGHIRIESESGKGTTLFISIPVS